MAETIKIGGELESTATGNVVAAASAIKDKTKNKYQDIINAETDVTLAQHTTAIQGLNSQNYVSVTATDQTTAATDVLPATGEADTVYRVGNWDGSQFDASVYSEYAWAGSQYVHLSTKTQIGEVFDISAYHATGGTLATYADLSAALDSNNGGGVPQSLQKGGMSVKYVCSSDNKYIQYRLLSDSFNTTVSNWLISDAELCVKTQAYAVSDVYLEEDTTNLKVFFTYNGGLVLRGSVSKDSTTISNLATALGVSLVTSTKGVQNCIAIEDSKSVVYNTADKTFELTDRSLVKPYHIIILSQANGKLLQWNQSMFPSNATLYNSVKDNKSDISYLKKYTNVYGSDDAAQPKIEENPVSKKVYFTFSGALYLRGTVTSASITISNLASQLGVSLVTSPNGLQNCIELSSYSAIVYDLKSSTYNIKATNNILATDVIIIEQLKGRVIQYITGLLYKTSIFDLDNRVTALENIPAYYERITKSVSYNNGRINKYRQIVSTDSARFSQPFMLKRGEVVYVTSKATNTTMIANTEGRTEFSVGEYVPQIIALHSDTYQVETVHYEATEDMLIMISYAADGNESVEFFKNNAISKNTPVYNRNGHRLSDVVTGCRCYYNNGDKDIQFAICTDIHIDMSSMFNSVDVLKDFDTIDAVISCGDFVADIYRDNNSIDRFNGFKDKLSVAQLLKPYLYVIGNHDVGNSKSVRRCSDHEETYNTFIKYMDDNNYFSEGEHPSGKCYYYKDFAPKGTRRGIRLITLYEYDNPIEFDETYWKAIVYDNTLPQIQANTAYSIGNKINVPYYTDYSFECVQGCTTDSSLVTREITYLPKYTTVRGWQIFRKEQLDWLLNTLHSTPNGYDVCIAMHQEFSQNTQNQTDKLFADKILVGRNVDDGQHYMGDDILANITNAFNGRQSFNEKVWYTGDAAIYNTLNDGSVDYAFEVTKDFSNLSADSKILCFIGGHWHSDMVLKHNGSAIYQIISITSHSGHYATSTGICTSIEQSVVKDCLTCIGFDGQNKKIRLSKIGATRVDNGDSRDFEVISLTS